MLSSIAFQNSNDFASVSSKQGETMKSILIAIVTLFSLGSAADIMVVQEETISEQSMKSCEEAKNKILQRLQNQRTNRHAWRNQIKNQIKIDAR